ncbi:hypothetical protein ACFX2F_010921 [Malus domestica]
MTKVVNPAGWSDDKHPECNNNVACEEYKCMGPGSSTYNKRNLSKELTDKQVQAFISLGYIQGRRFYAHITFLLDSSDAFRAMFDGGIIF